MSIIFGGMLLGTIVFIFSFIACKKAEKYHIAPIVTFLFAVAVIGYGYFAVGGFDGMGYGLIGSGFLIISIIGTIFLPVFIQQFGSKPFKKQDRLLLVVLPVLFFGLIGMKLYFEPVYWVIEQGGITYSEDGRRAGLESYYNVSTIAEGKKEVTLILGQEFLGSRIEVEKVNKRGPTNIIVKILEGGSGNKTPYIIIGLDEIKEPLTVKTSDGVIFKAGGEQILN